MAKQLRPRYEAILEAAEELLGEDFPRVVTRDFYSAYNPVAVAKQRCWAHLLRETRELKGEEGEQLHRELKELGAWIEGQLGRAPPGSAGEKGAAGALLGNGQCSS
ncbi:MAG: IS66 family transposase [Candidatus Bipolaricaulia bacterium]